MSKDEYQGKPLPLQCLTFRDAYPKNNIPCTRPITFEHEQAPEEKFFLSQVATL